MYGRRPVRKGCMAQLAAWQCGACGCPLKRPLCTAPLSQHGAFWRANQLKILTLRLATCCLADATALKAVMFKLAF